MTVYFEKLCKFDIDCKRLYDEWNRATLVAQAVKNPYIRTAVNRSNLDTANDQNFIGDRAKSFPIETYSAETLAKSFHGSYTEEVVALVEQWLNQQGLRSSRIKFAAMKPGAEIKTHVDDGYEYRYHLVVKTNNQSTITTNGEVHCLDDEGGFYKMLASVPHSAGNRGDCLRLLLTFDVAKNELPS